MFTVSRILARGHTPPLRPLVRLAHGRAEASAAPVLTREGSVGKHPFDLGEGPPPATSGGGGGKREKIRDGPADPIAGPSGRARDAEQQPQPEPPKEEGAQAPPPADAPTLPTPTTLPSRPPPAHPFDTYAFVSHLSGSDLAPATSRTLMEAVRAMINHRTGMAQTRMLSREEMDNVRLDRGGADGRTRTASKRR